MAVALSTILFASLQASAVAATPTATTLIGAGSTFDAPFFGAAFAAYWASHPVHVLYRSVGSGAGIAQFSAGAVDFGASDVPMNAAELAAARRMGGPVVQVPVTLGAVVIAYHLPFAGSRALRLDPATLARIFLGQITRWRDPAITRLNPQLNPPDLPIVTVHRADSSGTTYITTDYLSRVSAAWKATVGTGKRVRWPRGSVAGTGNGGVAALLRRRVGSIGYVELAYALANSIPFARLQNRDGAFQFPTTATVTEAALQFPHVSAAAYSIVDAPGWLSYPIVGYSWVLLRQRPRRDAAALVRLFRWLVTNGQVYAAQLNYVPLPRTVQAEALTALQGIRG
jgi:phosphate transport system substrate-binding protein